MSQLRMRYRASLVDGLEDPRPWSKAASTVSLTGPCSAVNALAPNSVDVVKSADRAAKRQDCKRRIITEAGSETGKSELMNGGEVEDLEVRLQVQASTPFVWFKIKSDRAMGLCEVAADGTRTGRI